MAETNTTFGEIILTARREKGLNLRECALLILKEDGAPISFQYLNDLENNRRKPPSEHIIEQLSKVLNIPVEILYFYAEVFPRGLNKNANREQIVTAYKNFVKSLSQKIPA